MIIGISRGASAWRLDAGWFLGATVVVLSLWVLHSFLPAVTAACIGAIASWPLYRGFAARVAPRITRSGASLVFTAGIAVFVAGPLLFAFAALATELNALLLDIAAADRTGIAVPDWLREMPWLAGVWEGRLSHPGALRVWTERTDVLGLAQSVGQFMGRHALIVLFTLLLLFFLYQRGESLADGIRRALRDRIGERAEVYVAVATGSVRALVNSMLVVALFVGLATSAAYTIAGAPHAGRWAAITGAVSLVPFLGYVAAAALALQLALKGSAAAGVVSLALASAVLFCADKIVRPSVARHGTRLPFVWVLMGCLGGFEVLGLVGLVIGPVVLAVASEMWRQRLRGLDSRETFTS